MLNKRPHTLSFLKDTGTAEPYQNENGDWVVPDNTPVSVNVPCRAEPNGQGKFIASEDGGNVVYSWLVFMDLETARIPYGTQVSISQDGVIIASETVKLFSKDQKKCRLWV